MKPRVLVVDDDDRNIVLLSVKLEREGYEIDRASNGIEALEKAQSFRPDLILMDVMMPKMDGYEALRILKARDATRFIPVIMLTGRTEVEDKVLGFEVGAEDYINKPYSLQEVAARVKSLLRVRALQTRVRETEKMVALGEIVDGIAHEIRNPLMTIGGMARRLYEGAAEEQQRSYSQTIIKSVERLERMLSRIDEYKVILSSSLSSGDLNKMVSATVREINDFIESSGKDITVATGLAPDLPQIEIDYGNLKVALYNVMLNSVEAISGSGSIRVDTVFSAHDKTVSVKVTDTGCGMTKEEIRKVFNPFQTTKFEGAGLGLTMADRIVRDHGGEIIVESEKGAGTSVTFRFHIQAPNNNK